MVAGNGRMVQARQDRLSRPGRTGRVGQGRAGQGRVRQGRVGQGRVGQVLA